MDSERMLSIDDYIRAAVSHGEATLSGDFRKANRQYGILSGYYSQIKDDPAALEIFSTLLSHDNVSVRIWSAAYLLPHNSLMAVRVLKEISKGEGIMAFNAKMVLENMTHG